MQIREGQTWVRQTFSKGSGMFPRHSWRVRILSVNAKYLSYKVIEYDGKSVDGDETVDVIDTFLTRFELEK